jgi:hypothetical protein
VDIGSANLGLMKVVPFSYQFHLLLTNLKLKTMKIAFIVTIGILLGIGISIWLMEEYKFHKNLKRYKERQGKV